MRKSIGGTAAAIAVVAALVLATAASAAGDASHGKVLYRYVGQLKARSGTTLTVTVQNGNRPALRSLLGQSQEQTFATAAKTVFLRWSQGKPTQVAIDDLAVGDYLAVNIRAAHGAGIDVIRATPAGLVGDHGPTLAKPAKPLFLFRGTLVAAGGDKVTIDVRGGNKRALRLLIGQATQQTFATSDDTVFLQWSHRVPTIVDPSQLRVGDPVIVRVRADAGSSLQVVESTVARRVAAHEPKPQEQSQSSQA